MTYYCIFRCSCCEFRPTFRTGDTGVAYLLRLYWSLGGRADGAVTLGLFYTRLAVSGHSYFNCQCIYSHLMVVRQKKKSVFMVNVLKF